MNVVKQHIQLRELQSGQIAKVISISGDPREIARVSSLGLRTGEVISVTRGGITCIIEFCNGNQFCLRMSDGLEILVKTI